MNPRTLTSSGTALHFNESKQYGWLPGETRECNCGRNYGAPHRVRKVTWYNHRRNRPILHDRAYIQDDEPGINDDEPSINDVPQLVIFFKPVVVFLKSDGKTRALKASVVKGL